MEIELEFENFSNIALKKDHYSRPIWITPDNRVFLETLKSTHNTVWFMNLTRDFIKKLLINYVRMRTSPEIISFINKNTKNYQKIMVQQSFF